MNRTHRSTFRRWSLLAARFEPLEPRAMMAGEVVINELHYNPDVETQLVEFIELHNTTAAAIDLSNWSFSQGVNYVFPQGASIAAGGYYVIAENAAQFQSKFGVAPQTVYAGGLDGEAETVRLKNAADVTIDEVDYQVGFPWPTVGDQVVTPGDGHSIQLINATLDNGLGGSWRSAVPTPGRVNGVFAANSPPAMRQVNHAYLSNGLYAAPGDTVEITARITDAHGVTSAALAYQIVEPGQYIEIGTAAYNTNWTTVAMRDDGLEGDDVAGDGIYTVVLPASLQQHRRMIRYRITSTDTLGASVTGPYADDDQPNFAYYVYGATPSWTGATRPGATAPVTYTPVLLDSLATYHLITTRNDHEDAQYIPNGDQGRYTGDEYLWQGALVSNGEVYDHVRYRARGGVWRYAMGKNMWKFDFNRGHEFQAHDDYGQPYEEKWKKLNFSAIIQQGDYQHRGEQGLFESVGFKLFNLAGVEGPNTHFAHFRIVENASEIGVNQFSTDFQGLYLAIEQPDGQMLEQHGLPDGNLYKMEGGTGSLNNQGPTQPSNKADLNLFQTTYVNGSPSNAWWRQNFDLERYYSYRSIVEAIHHYDIDESAGKNYFYYHNPETGKWSVLPWDLDLTWANNMFGNGREPFRDRVLTRPEFAIEYRNRVREIRDLLYNAEQTGLMIDEMAALIYTPGQPSWVDADRAMWDYNPILASSFVNPGKAGQGRFYLQAANDTFPGMMQIMKNYVASRGSFIDSTILTDESQVPQRPTVAYTGQAGFPADALEFSNSAFVSPSGSSFAALEWRIAEITDPTNPNYDPAAPKSYEITPAWESGRITSFSSSGTVPGDSLRAGQTYRVRVRYQDAAGRWSHWSQPVQFVAGAPLVTAEDKIRVTELNYHAAAPSAAEIAAGFTDPDGFDYIEIQNIHGQPVNVGGYQFTTGVEFVFPSMVLQPGEKAVVVEDREAFQFRYGFGAIVAGEFDDGKLDNGGERIVLVTGGGGRIVDFTYRDDDWYPSTDGAGHTLVIVNAAAPLNVDPVTGQSVAWSSMASWRASSNSFGSPGIDDPALGSTTPATPTNPAANSPLFSQVNVSWTDASTNEEGFKIERRIGTAGVWSEIGIVAAGAQSFLDTNLQAATQYFYRVRAYNAAGVSRATDTVSVTTQAPPIPAAPSGLSAGSAFAGQIDLVWTDNSAEEALFKIERKTGAAGGWVEVGTVGTNVTGFSNTGLMPNTTYFYRVRASNSGGDSGYSNEASATTAAGVANLVGQWLFDEPNGDNNVRDTSFTGNHGTLTNGVQRIVGTAGAQAGNAVAFDGINDFVGVGQNLATTLGGNATLATWIRTTQIGNNTFWQAPGITGVEESGAGNDVFWGWIDATGRIGIQAGNAAGAKSANPINDNQWHHVAFTRDSATGQVRVYVDGVLSGSAVSEPGLKTTPFTSLGRIQDTAGTHAYFEGRLDELQMFDRVLTQAEIQALRTTNVVRQGTNSNDTFIVNRSTTNGYIRIYQNQLTSETPSYAIQPDLLGSLQIDGLAGDDAVSILINGTAGYPIRAGGFIFNGGDGNDTLSINGNSSSGAIPHTFAAGPGTNTLTITSGQLTVDSTATGGELNTSVLAGAQLTTSRLKQNSLTLGPGSRVILLPGGAQANVLTTLDLGTSGTLDLADNDLVLKTTAAGKSADFNALYSRLVAGFAGGTWNGNGVVSSAAQTNTNTTVALADNAVLGFSTFGGEPVDANSLLLKYTYYGDIDQNGQVDADDLTVFANNFGRTSGATQVDGDVDFNGTVDADDLTVFANNFRRGVGNPLAAVSGGVVSGEWSGRSNDEALVDLLARAIADDALTSSGEGLTDSRLATSRRVASTDGMWSGRLWRSR